MNMNSNIESKMANKIVIDQEVSDEDIDIHEDLIKMTQTVGQEQVIKQMPLHDVQSDSDIDTKSIPKQSSNSDEEVPIDERWNTKLVNSPGLLQSQESNLHVDVQLSNSQPPAILKNLSQCVLEQPSAPKINSNEICLPKQGKKILKKKKTPRRESQEEEKEPVNKRTLKQNLKELRIRNLRYKILDQGLHLFKEQDDKDMVHDDDHDLDVKALQGYEFIIDIFTAAIGRFAGVDKNVFDKASFDKYLKSKTGQWMIIDEMPSFLNHIQTWENMFIKFYFERQRLYHQVRISSVFDLFSDVERHMVMSWITKKCKDMVGLGIPPRYVRFNTLSGADHQTTELEDLKKDQQQAQTYLEGWYYGRKYQVKEYAPQKLEGASFFFYETGKGSSNDCLAHAVNFALRYPWFTCREQLIRLVRLRNKCTLQEAEQMKIEGGIPLSVMKDIAIVNGKSISLEHIQRLDLFKKGQGTNALMDIVKEKMLESNELNEMIIVGMAQGVAIPYTHCLTLVKVGKSIALCDNTQSEVNWYPCVPKGQVGEKMIYHDRFDQYQIMELFSIQGKKASKKLQERVNREMEAVMTGQKRDYSEKRRDMTNKINKKRKGVKRLTVKM